MPSKRASSGGDASTPAAAAATSAGTKDRRASRARSDETASAAAAAAAAAADTKRPSKAATAVRSKDSAAAAASAPMEDEAVAAASAVPTESALSPSAGSAAKRAKLARTAASAGVATSASPAAAAALEEEMKESSFAGALAAPAAVPSEADNGDADDGAAAAAAAAAESDSDGEGGGGEYSARGPRIDPSLSTLYEPSQAAEPEVADPSDPYGSAAQRQAVLLGQLAPLYLPPELPGLESERAMLLNLLRSTLDDQSSTACLLLGPSGSGKSALLSSVFRDLTQSLVGTGRGFVRVTLNGLIQRDDTAAMRELVVQLCAALEIEQFARATKFDEYLDFLRKVLAGGALAGNTPLYVILDHFEEFAARPKQTLLYNLCDLLQHPQATIGLVGVSSQLDAYEKLEKRIRSRMSHRRILVGVESHALGFGGAGGAGFAATAAAAESGADPAELRKRRTMDALVAMLRARLEIHPIGADAAVSTGSQSQSQSQSARQASDESRPLSLTMSPTPSPPPRSPQEERKTAGSKRKTPAASAAAVAAAAAAAASDAAAAAASSSSSAPALSPAVLAHNASIARLFCPRSSPLLWARLSSLVHVLPSGWFLRVSQWSVAHALGPRHVHLTQRDLLDAVEYALRDWRIEGIKYCSVLELTLLVSYVLLTRAQLPRLNFTQIYAHYLDFHRRSNIAMGASAGAALGASGVAGSVPFFSESVALSAWESMLSQNLLLVWADGHPPLGGAWGSDPAYTGSLVARQFAAVKCRLRDDELTAALRGRKVTAPTWLVQWITKGHAE